ncbi:MAG: DUF86 domain-containing protein [Defluviitaleaceae bacterium]|nr:DUF86 domain-containing protein [Defluviitaleaceae bacterium]
MGILTIEEISNKLTPIFEEKGVIKAILFGSYAKGKATEESDIDLAVEVEERIIGLDFYGIAWDISESLGKKVDFFDLEDIIPNGRADLEIRNSGVMIYTKRNDKEIIRKINKYCQQVCKSTKDIDFEAFISDDKFEKLGFNSFALFQIGELSSNLSEELVKKYPDFNWKNLYQLRNIIAHNYDGMRIRRIWEICIKNIPVLLKYTEKIMEETE